MNDPRNRFLLFILGLTVGAMVSGAAVYLALNKEKSALSISKGMLDEIAGKVSVLLKRERSEEATASKNDQIAPSLKQDADSSMTYSSEELTKDEIPDSLENDTVQGEDFIVKKDELIEVRTIEVAELTADQNLRTKADSILEQASGIRSDKRASGEKIVFSIEFWRSPVNYKGYKLGKNKLILFGLENTVPVSVFKYNSAIYLKYDQLIYRLDSYNDFRAFEKITDPGLISIFSHS